MLDFFKTILFLKPFICHLGNPQLIGLHSASDSIIALTYYAIGFLFFYFRYKYCKGQFQNFFGIFGAFAIASGTTHIAEVWTLWHSTYWLSGCLKAITAVISVYATVKMGLLISEFQLLAQEKIRHDNLLCALQKAQENLEIKIEQRTEHLKQTADQLIAEIVQHYQVQKALHESEALLRNVLDNLPVGVLVADKEGRIYRANLEGEKIWGGIKYIGIEQYGEYKGWWADTGRQIEAREWALFRAIAQGERAMNEVIEIEAFDGKRKTILNSAIPLQNSQEEIIGAIAVCQDITQYQLVEKAFWENQRLIQQVAEATPAILYIYDLIEQRNIYSNRQVSEILGYSPEAVQEMGSSFIPTVLHPDDRAKAAETCQRFVTFKEGEIAETEYRMKHANGEWRWLYSRETVLTRTADGLPQQILGTATDITFRKLVEEALRHSEQQLRAVFESAMDAMAIADDRGRYVAANPAMSELFGLPQAKLIGRCIAEFAEGDFDFAQAWQAFRERGRERGEFRITRPDGTRRDVEYTAIANFLPNRHLSCMRDITKRKQTEAELSQYHEHLEQSVQARTGELRITNKLLQAEILERERAEDVMQQLLQRERLIAASAQRIRQTLDLDVILRTTVAEVRQFLQVDRVLVYRLWPDGTGSTIAEAVVPECPAILGMTFAAEVFPQEFHQLYCQGRIRTVIHVEDDKMTPCLVEFLQQLGVKAKLVVPILQGEKLWGLLIAHQICQPRQWQPSEIDLLKQLAIQVTIAIQQAELYQQIQDELTERKKAEAALRESQAKYKTLFEILPLGISITDERGNVVEANPASERILGLSLTEHTTRKYDAPEWQLVRPDATPMPASEFPSVIALRENRIIKNCEAGVVKGESEIAWISITAAPIPLPGYGVAIAYTDMTERKQVERMKDEFISVVSHELRTPLTSLRGALGLLSTGLLGGLSEKGQQMLEFAVADTDRLTRLVNDILDLERLKLGKITLTQQICDAADLIRQVVELMQPIAQKAKVTLSVVPVSLRVWADGDRIIQVLTNLLGNAIKFSSQGATVCLSVEAQGNQILFQVKDRGRGIPAEKLEIIFEPFQQVDASDSRHEGGTGLGLAISRSIVKQHGGNIWAESVLGHGSSFCFILPMPEN